MADKLQVSVSPHVHSGESVSKVMWAVAIALMPSGIAGVIIFGISALKVIFISVSGCVIFEALTQKLTHKRITISDGSAVLTGLLLAYNLSAGVPFWLPLSGAFFAIVIVKQAFGGLGGNIFNPALAARAFLLASWPRHMTIFLKPFSPDGISSATPLTLFKEGGMDSVAKLNLGYWDLFIGNRGGCLGEVCILALLLGAGYLLWKKYIWPQAPLGFILSLGILSWMFDARGFLKGDFVFSILSGGLILGAFYMATDYVTTPIIKKGQLVFGLACGLLAFIIRRFGGYPEGVSYSILIMNAATPLIDRYVRLKRYGNSKRVKEKK